MTTPTTESWVAVGGFEGIYEVSSLGRVRSLDRKVPNRHKVDHLPGQALHPSMTWRGYLFVTLCKNGLRKQVYVHRLVATAFLAQSECPHVNHIDSCRTNNAAENLEWVTPQQNTHHAIAAGRFALAHLNGRSLASNNPARSHKLTVMAVELIRAACAAGERQADIGRRFGVGQSVISKIKRGELWTAHPRDTEFRKQQAERVK